MGIDTHMFGTPNSQVTGEELNLRLEHIGRNRELLSKQYIEAQIGLIRHELQMREVLHLNPKP